MNFSPDLIAANVQLFFALVKFFFLFREAQELIESLLVNVIVLLEVMVCLFQLLE